MGKVSLSDPPPGPSPSFRCTAIRPVETSRTVNVYSRLVMLPQKIQ